MRINSASSLPCGILDKVPQLKALKRELEQRRHKSDWKHAENTEASAPTQVRQTHLPGDIMSGLSKQMYGPIKPPQLEITPFSGDVLKWKEFWDAFETSIDKTRYAPIDKLPYGGLFSRRKILANSTNPV